MDIIFHTAQKFKIGTYTLFKEFFKEIPSYAETAYVEWCRNLIIPKGMIDFILENYW